MAVLSDFLDPAALTPHGFCLSWERGLMALQVVSDSLIAGAYYSIPFALVVFLLRRNDIAFRWVFWAFALFILACGTTHAFDVLVLWEPDYWSQGVVKAITALLSVLTAIGLWPMIPEALALPSPSALQAANRRLAEEIGQRDATQVALQHETAERLRTETMLQQAQRMEAIGQLTGGVAHDFNNLLMAIQGNLEALETRMEDSDPRRLYVDRCIQSIDRGAALTHQLLAYARRQRLEPQIFDANGRIERLSELLRATLGGAITLETVKVGALWPIEADPSQLDTALLNLLVNARDAMPLGGRVMIETANIAAKELAATAGAELAPGDYVRISVRDNGTGMTREVREAAFEPFFTTKPIGRGSGLGLSQVYGFVKQSGGHVTVESEPGKGTAVMIFLPRPIAGVMLPPRLETQAAGASGPELRLS